MSDRSPSLDQIRRSWLARLGQTVVLDHAFFVVEDVVAAGPGRTVVLGELANGVIATGDSLEAVGIQPTPVPTTVASIERPLIAGGVESIAVALAGGAFALTLEHDPSSALAVGQCLAPAGRLRSTKSIDTSVWILQADDLPGSPLEQRRLIERTATELELFFHSLGVAATATAPWKPALGEEFQISFALAHPVALYPATRFALRIDEIVIGAGIVR